MRYIDVHHHFLPAAYVQALEEQGITMAGDVTLPGWSPDASLKVMDAAGIERAYLSISAPGVSFGDTGLAARLARLANDEASNVIASYPERFGAFATLPVPDVDASLEELARALDDLHLDGVALLSNADGVYLGDQRLDALMSELDRRGTVVFIHPASPPNEEAIGLPYPAAMMEFPFETTRAATNLVFGGVIKKYPGIKFILAHAGGTIPFLAGRISLTGLLLQGSARAAPRGADHYFRCMYYDTALSTSDASMAALRTFVDSSHVVFGSDFPFAPGIIAQQSVEWLETCEAFSGPEKILVARENALGLLPSEEKVFDD